MLFLFFILFAGCGIPVSRTTIIPKGVAQTPEHLIARLDLLKTGMEIGEVFELLDIKRSTPGVREIVNAEEKQRMLYGDKAAPSSNGTVPSLIYLRCRKNC